MTAIAELTPEHLGADADDIDLAIFKSAVDAYCTRHGVDEETAIDVIWADGDWWRNVIDLGLLFFSDYETARFQYGAPD